MTGQFKPLLSLCPRAKPWGGGVGGGTYMHRGEGVVFYMNPRAVFTKRLEVDVHLGAWDVSSVK